MVEESRIRRIYSEIQRQLFYMIPEKWSKVYLYSSIIERQNNLETGELYFYYIPKGVLKKNPVNVYEIPYKFSINDEEYLKLVDKLYGEIKRLRRVCMEQGDEKWYSVIISIGDFKFNVEYNYEDLSSSKYSSFERHLIFRYKYLDYPITSFNKNERRIINQYLYETLHNKPKTKIYSETMYEMPYNTIEIGSKNSNIQYVKEEQIQTIKEDYERQKDIKSQILKSGF